MDISDTIVPRSDQANAEDFLTGPRTVTITAVKKGSVEQPVEIELLEFPGRPFKPSKTVRRILVAAWGPEAASYVGRRMTLYRDPAVKFGGMDVGGIRVSHLSHIDKPLSVALTVSRGKRQPYTVRPLTDAGASADTGASGQRPHATEGHEPTETVANHRPGTAPASPAPWTAAVAAASTEDELRAVWKRFAADTDDDGRAALTQAMTSRRSELQEGDAS